MTIEQAQQLYKAALKAQAATDANRPWRYSPHYQVITTSNVGILEGSRDVAKVEHEDVGQFIVECQPSVIISLIEATFDVSKFDK
jgi:hypothetical protein